MALKSARRKAAERGYAIIDRDGERFYKFKDGDVYRYNREKDSWKIIRGSYGRFANRILKYFS